MKHVAVDKAGYIWASGSRCVAKCRYAEGRLAVERTYKIFLPMELSCDDAGDMWIATAGIYVYRIAHDT